jgi:hypothetical protein
VIECHYTGILEHGRALDTAHNLGRGSLFFAFVSLLTNPTNGGSKLFFGFVVHNKGGLVKFFVKVSVVI